MGIDAVVKSESGDVIEQVSDPRMILSTFVLGADNLNATFCLRFLDPYGDACFNQLQIPFLALELTAAAVAATVPEVKQHLRKVADLVERAREVHTYVWFVGD